MINKVILSLVISFLVSTSTAVQAEKQVEIFDIGKGEVTMVVQLNSGIQKEVETFLKSITDVNRMLNPVPRDGFMVKVPLEPTYLIQNKWLNDLVDEVIVMFPSKNDPCLMVFDNENRAHFFMFTGETDTFLTKLKIIR